MFQRNNTVTKHSRILVTGAGGFIRHHLVKRLKAEGHWVRGADLKYPEYSQTDWRATLAERSWPKRRLVDYEEAMRSNRLFQGARRQGAVDSRFFGCEPGHVRQEGTGERRHVQQT
jgi:nucleoside-diphosphate-sugar epimerase